MRDGAAICRSKYALLSKSLHQVNVFEAVLFLFTATLYTLIVNHNLDEYLCKKIMSFILRQKTIAWQKSATFRE